MREFRYFIRYGNYPDEISSMKKFTLLLLLITSTNLSLAQELKKITVPNSLKQEYLSKVYSHDDYCVYFENEENLSESYLDERFEFYLNDSIDTLIIFDGKLCGGHESGVVNVYRISKGTPTTTLSRSGKIAGMIEDTLWVYTYPCCAEILNIIAPISISSGETLGKAHVFYSRENYSLIFPFSEKAMKYRLSSNSEIHWSPSTSEPSHTSICQTPKNIIGSIEKGKPLALIEVTNDDWALIRLDNMPTWKAFCTSEYHNALITDDEYILYCWIPIKNIKWE